MIGAAAERLPVGPPEVGALVQVRSRRWIVQEVEGAEPPDSPVVRLSCAEDDSPGEPLEVFWNHEPDRKIFEDEGWRDLAGRGFDAPRQFAAFYRTLRWNCVTATDPALLQAPFRAGIQLDAYQMEPLRKALRLPRVNLFIADDTGLGKTIEAGLIARELLLRRKAKSVVIAAPASVLDQWRLEMEERFGLLFAHLDRAYVSRIRRERGFGANPWRTHTRFLVSHNLLRDPAYADPMREWLGERLPASLLILDEAHHAAPSSGGRYGIESKFTRAVRDLAGRFEHRLFLSATPHNGHSNSFAALMELLDPRRFTRGVPIGGRRELEPVLVRRLKEDLRAAGREFPERRVEAVVIADLPADAPELRLSRLLDDYRREREQRLESASKRARTAGALLTVGLQQRLLSSIEAFARNLRVHRRTAERQYAETTRPAAGGLSPDEERRFRNAPDADDERADWDDEDLEREEDAQTESLTRAAEIGGGIPGALPPREREILDDMTAIAEEHRHLPDAKTGRLLDWIRENQCPDLPPLGQHPKGPPPRWTDRRVLVFTENRQGTKHYLKTLLDRAVEYTDRADGRIAVLTGQTGPDMRREIQRRFNADPKEEPLRILIATDAAREGLNLQAHCSDLFHFDLPWNPGRIEQRNGRIDRKLQPAKEVTCRYFQLPQRAEDRVLEVLVRKTETIRKELGSLARVIDDSERLLRGGIRAEDAASLAEKLAKAGLPKPRVVQEELETARDGGEAIERQLRGCRDALEKSRDHLGFDRDAFRDALSCSLELQGAPGLVEEGGSADNGTGGDRKVWRLPELNEQQVADPSWTATLDSLRAPRKLGVKLADWRRDAPIRPVVFADPGAVDAEVVHLHLEQRLAQRLLARFRSQGFVHHDLSRACLLQAEDSIHRVVLLGRLSLYGRGAERLHQEIVAVAASFDGYGATRPPKPFGETGKEHDSTLALLEKAMEQGATPGDRVRSRLLSLAPRQVPVLRKALERRARARRNSAEGKLRKRGEAEAESLEKTLRRQRERVKQQLEGRSRQEERRLLFELKTEERRQREADIRAWERRLTQFAVEIEEEPKRVREFYEVRATRVEPVGLVYLWPDTG